MRMCVNAANVSCSGEEKYEKNYSYTHVDDTTAESALTSLAKFLSEVQIYHSNSLHSPACKLLPKTQEREEYVIYIPHQFSVL